MSWDGPDRRALTDETLLKFAQLLGSHDSKLDMIDRDLKGVKEELHGLRTLILPKRILKISVSGGALAAAVAGVLSWALA